MNIVRRYLLCQQAARLCFYLALSIIVECLPSPACANDPSAADQNARPSGGQGGEPGVFKDEKLTVEGRKRKYYLVAPKSLAAERPAPLMFAFHGAGDTDEQMAGYTRLEETAEKHGFVLVFPNSQEKFWPTAQPQLNDELAFFDALYDRLTQQYNIDLDRVYLAGMSNGAYFLHILAARRAEKIAAIAPHSGGLGALGRKALDVRPKYAVFVAHGDADSVVPISESRQTRDAYRKWGHPVEYLEVPGLDHAWAAPADVNEKMWAYFAEHPLQAMPR